MTPAQADQRIVLSRHTLTGYLAVGSTGKIDDLIHMITEEIGILESIAEEHVVKAPKLAALVMEWVAFREGMKAKLH